MADDETCEVDVEGDFESEYHNDAGYDSNELPSKSVNLLPEYTHHPWALEQGWSLDHCSDEKSKAAIEKMLTEEQSSLLQGYAKSSGTYNKKPSKIKQRKESDVIHEKMKNASHRKPWTADEKSMFFTALEIFGRQWSKIAEVIPSRSVMQVKNFGLQHFKSAAKEEEPKSATNGCGNTQLPLSTLKPSRPLSSRRLSDATGGLPDRITSSCDYTSEDERSVQRSHPRTGNAQMSHDDLYSVRLPAVDPGIIDGTVVKIEKAPEDGQDEEIDIEDEDSVEGSLAINIKEEAAVSSYERLLQTAGTTIRHAAHFCNTISTECAPESPKTKEPLLCMYESHEKQSYAALEGDANTSNAIAMPFGCGDSPVASLVIKHADMTPLVEAVSPLTNNLADEERDVTACDHSSSKASSSSLDFEENYVPFLRPEYGVLNSNGELVAMPAPTAAADVDRDAVTQLEKTVHFEFFDGRPQKTSERYVKIRNYILEQWDRCKPNYLYKTYVRVGLKNCGDVNCIGRIHAFLEQIGAINFGCEQANYCRMPMTSCMPSYKKRPTTEPFIAKEPSSGSACCSTGKLDTRPRNRQRASSVFAVSGREESLEGHTIEHDEDSEKSAPQVLHNHRTTSKQRTSAHDPFRLVRCRQFTAETPAPYHVLFEASALIVMDVHAHVSKMEVIGILGGHFDAAACAVVVSCAEPCDSCSTAVQCEMDPVSQTRAGEAIRRAGLCVVGWYHSHPSFVPSPSLTDVESQEKFQNWFAQEGDHFVGVIISPYNTENRSPESEVTCFTTSGGHDTKLGCRHPYQLTYEVVANRPMQLSASNVLDKVKVVVEQYFEHQHGVDLLDTYRSTSSLSCLAKMLLSIESYGRQAATAPDAKPAPLTTLVDGIVAIVSAFYGGVS